MPVVDHHIDKKPQAIDLLPQPRILDSPSKAVAHVSKRQFLPVSVIESFLAGYVAKGRDPAPLIAALGLPSDLLRQPEGVFPIAKLGDLIATVSLELQDETLGFLARPTRIGGLETSINAIISSRSLHEALDRFMRFWSLVHDDFAAQVCIKGDEAQVDIRFTQAQGVNDKLDFSGFTTWIIFVTLRIAGWLVDKPLLLDRLYFSFAPPKDLEDFRDMFPTALYFQHESNITVFNKRFLDLPVLQTPAEVPDFVRILPHLITVRRSDQSLTGQIRRMLEGRENFEAIPLKTIAEQLNKSPDTIRRHLKTEGNSFKEIKESVRRNLAVDRLALTDEPISQIAYRLGFSEPSAFNRAFKNWTGLTPGDYRKQAPPRQSE